MNFLMLRFVELEFLKCIAEARTSPMAIIKRPEFREAEPAAATPVITPG